LEGDRILLVLDRLRHLLSSNLPLVEETKGDPFLVLLSALLSHRTKDEVTLEVIRRLKGRLKGPEDVLKMGLEQLEALIYPVGFYRKKARIIREVSRRLIEEYGGRVPETLEALLNVKGIGRKTANLVLAQGYAKEGLAVDTHVQRVSARLGLVDSSRPERTEKRLKVLIPKELWSSVNLLFVQFGRQICRPVSPVCSACPIFELCERKGVGSSR
jgi:endonuclease-3